VEVCALRRSSGEGGFTLIELIAVMSVLAVLAVIVILNVAGVAQNGGRAACQTDVHSIATAMSAYYNEQNPLDWNGNFVAGNYASAGGGDPYPVFDPLVPTFLHTHPGSSCATMTIADASGGGKTVSTP
jgi:prepilin-type N-terminal cleavage/methylation domain-containing protein